MQLSFTKKKNIRKSFGKLKESLSIPNLIEVQKRSFDSFLQLKTDPDKRENMGLHSVFKSVFPINDYAERATVDYISYNIKSTNDYTYYQVSTNQVESIKQTIYFLNEIIKIFNHY